MPHTRTDFSNETTVPAVLGTRQWIFIGSMVALDFSFGFMFKHILSAIGVSKIVNLDMAVPVTLMMLTRLVIDRFGVLTAYELSWAVLAIFGLPNAILPGPLKLIPAIVQGLVYDLIFSALRRLPYTRVFAAAILGSLFNKAMVMFLRVWILNLPWANITKTLFGLQEALSILVYALAASLALTIWKRVEKLQITQLLKVN
jgi:hypothetical protein